MFKYVRSILALALFLTVAVSGWVSPAVAQDNQDRIVFNSGRSIREFSIIPGSERRPALVSVRGVREFDALARTDVMVGFPISFVDGDARSHHYIIYSIYRIMGVHCGNIPFYPQMLDTYLRVPGLVVVVDNDGEVVFPPTCTLIAAFEIQPVRDMSSNL